MDKHKKSRAVLRASFSKKLKQLETAVSQEDSTEVKALMELVQKKYEELGDINNIIYEALLADDADQEVLEKEMEDSDGYSMKWLNVKAKVNALQEERVSNVADVEYHSEAGMASANSVFLENRRHFKLPQLELKKFGGELKEWLPFWAQFKKIHEDLSIEEGDKFQYLIQATISGSRARALVESFPASSENYPKAIECLKARYAKDDLLVEVYVRDLLKLVLQNTLSSEKTSLSFLYDRLESQLRALETLNVTSKKCAAMLMPLVESSLPEEILRTWQRSSQNLEGDANAAEDRLERLMKFLRMELENEEKIKLAMSGFNRRDGFRRKDIERRKDPSTIKKMSSAAGLLTTANVNNCVFCESDHSPTDCPKAQRMSVKDRKVILDKKGCCYNCLKSRHRVVSCWNKSRCIVCNKKHNVLICDDISPIRNSQYDQKHEKEINVLNDGVVSWEKTLSNVEKSPKVLLQTLVVKMIGDELERTVRAIIDSASQRSYILRSTALKMKYKSMGKENVQHALFGGLNTNVVRHEIFKVRLADINNKYRCHFEVLDQELICDRIPPINKNLITKELKDYNISLTDFVDGPIEILIGADVCGKLLTGKKQSLSSGLVAIETELGWTIIGKEPGKIKPKHAAMTVTSMLTKEAEIANLWSLDVLGIEEPSEKKKKCELQEAAEKHFLETVSVDNEGRFLVHLPWLENHPPLPDNYKIALKRLDSTVKKLKSDNLYDAYDLVFQEWHLEGVIEEVPSGELNTTAHYLPHRAVVKENSTTKIRPVFDASAKEKNKPSLNSCVEKGKNLISLITSVLIHFRMKKIGVVSDIRKAFLQIGLTERDRNFLRFLWTDKEGNLKIYRHRRVVFGVSCSPFLLGAVINHHLKNKLIQCENNNNVYSRNVIKQLSNSFYVDNCITGVNDEKELESFIQEFKAIMNEAKFELRGWEYTHDVLKSVDRTNDYEANCNVLGVTWNKNLDTLEINLENIESFGNSQITKRVILSAAHKLFDPTGVISPVLLLPKLLLQRICEAKTGWDQEVDEEVKDEFIRWYRALHHLKQVKIPRWLLGTNQPASYMLHIFCDASQYVYAAVVFLKTVTYNEVNVQLIQAKSRIAPRGKQNKKMTIPRLELLAAVIAVRLYDSVIKELDIPIQSTIFWSDSTTVLAWITREENWDIFVFNRVAEIRKFTSKYQWCYVRGTDNPADLPSRGCSAKKLKESCWWMGPQWLKEPTEDCYLSNYSYDEDEINSEKKKSVMSSCTMVCTSNNTDWYYKYFSSYQKIVRLIAWILRFRKNTLVKKEFRKYDDVSTEEYSFAEKCVLRLVQQESFMGPHDPKLSTLRPFIDDDGLLRLKTKVSHRDDIEDFCYPIVLPNQSHPVVNRLVLHIHKDSAHAGIQTMLTILRRRFWVLSSRRTIRSVVSKCLICKRYRAKGVEVDSPPLPIDRVRQAKIFEIIGVDLAGPIYLKHNEASPCKKAWICLFTCAVYRAVHLELLSSLSTDTFLQGLRRFVGRRGRPAIIYSDNGTNFVGSSNALLRVDWSKIKNHSAIKGIRWKFNPPTAAWWGGWWERLVGIVKQLLRRVLGKTSLDYEEMQTLLCECESIINSRPLTYISEDSLELAPLTPNMFLQEISEVGVPDLDMVEVMDYNRKQRYRHQLRNVLKERFRDEYLGRLILHNKKCGSRQVKVGEVVLVEIGKTNRLDWPLARVEEVIPGREGTVRLVKLKTSTGTILRPVQKVYPLEIEFAESEENKNISHRVMKSQDSVGQDKSKTDLLKTSECIVESPIEEVKKEKFSRYGRRIKPRLS